MKAELIVTLEDQLNFQLYNASVSKHIQKNRKKLKWRVPVIYFILGLLMWWIDKSGSMISLFIIGCLWYFIYPIWERKHYINHYKKSITENYKETKKNVCFLEINDEFIEYKDIVMESKVKIIDLTEIVEIQESFFLKLKSGLSLIIPKRSLHNIEEWKAFLKQLIVNQKGIYTENLTWKWE